MVDRTCATKNSINGNYTATHLSLLFPRHFPNPPHRTVDLDAAAGVFACAKEGSESEGESLPESLRKVPFGVVETDQSSRVPFIPFLPLGLLPSFFQTTAKMGLAFNARRKVLKNWPRHPWMYTDWLIVCSEFRGYGLNRRFYSRVWIRVAATVAAAEPAKSDVSPPRSIGVSKSSLLRRGAMKRAATRTSPGTLAAYLISWRAFKRTLSLNRRRV